jgi:hypothetical protein
MKRLIILAIALVAAANYDPKPAKKDTPKKVVTTKQGPTKFTF